MARVRIDMKSKLVVSSNLSFVVVEPAKRG